MIYFISIFEIQLLDFKLGIILRRSDFGLLNLIQLIRKFLLKTNHSQFINTSALDNYWIPRGKQTITLLYLSFTREVVMCLRRQQVA